jgi:Fe-S-cluster containining protein
MFVPQRSVAPTDCRIGCAACCIAPSISSPIPGMPGGKPSGVRCVQLTDDNRCRLFGLPERPTVCVRLRPMPEMCGTTAAEALDYLTHLENETRPNPQPTRPE